MISRTRKNRVVAIVQARMNSSRLPGKVLMNLGDKSNLQHVVERIQQAKYVKTVVVATTLNPADDKIVKFCKTLKNCVIIRGSEDDVLERTIQAGSATRADIIVDVTADCPLVDPKHIDILISQFIKKDVVYASNIIHRTWPDGFDIQVYRFKTLLQIDMLTYDLKHRMHSGWNILRSEKWENMYSLTTKILSHQHPEWNLSLDEKNDYKLLDIIFRHFGTNKFSCSDVMNYINKHIYLLEINNNKIRKTAGQG